MMKSKILYICVLLGVAGFLSGCGDPWTEHLTVGESDANKTLVQRLEGEGEASVFLSLLKEADLGVALKGANSYTVFAPSNQSLQSLASALRADKDALNNFVKNHIAVSTHRLNTTADTIQLTMLNGKILDLVASRIGGVSFNKSNQGGADGLYHLLAGPLMPQQNIWEYIQANVGYAQNQFIVGLNSYKLYEDGVIDSPEDSLLNNELLHFAGDLQVEKDRYTYFVLQNDAFQQDAASFLPYVNYRNQPDSSLEISKYYIARDLIFRQAYDKESLPAELISMSGARFPVDKSAITESIQLSNGYVHVLSTKLLQQDVDFANKLTGFKIEGEEPTSFSTNRTANTFYRVRKDPTGVLFQDIMIQNHTIAGLTINYDRAYWLSTSYDVYWRALNDIQTNVFQQRVSILGPVFTLPNEAPTRLQLHAFPLTDVRLMNYDEVYLGAFELSEFQKIRVQLIAAATAANGNNTLVLDYLRFEPKVK